MKRNTFNVLRTRLGDLVVFEKRPGLLMCSE